MIDPATLTMDHVFEVMNAWAAKYARMHDQLVATLAEKDTLTAERDETRKELTQCTKDIAHHHDRARVMQEQRDKALAEVREAKRERDALAAAMTMAASDIKLLREYVVDNAGNHEEDCPLDDTCNCRFRPRNEAVNRMCEWAYKEQAAPFLRAHDEALTRPLEEQLAAKDRQIAELAAVVCKAKVWLCGSSLDAERILGAETYAKLMRSDDNQEWQEIFGDTGEILSAYLREQSRPLVEALGEIREYIFSEIDCTGPDPEEQDDPPDEPCDGPCFGCRIVKMIDSALAAWREQHPELPEGGVTQ